MDFSSGCCAKFQARRRNLDALLYTSKQGRRTQDPSFCSSTARKHCEDRIALPPLSNTGSSPPESISSRARG